MEEKSRRITGINEEERRECRSEVRYLFIDDHVADTPTSVSLFDQTNAPVEVPRLDLRLRK